MIVQCLRSDSSCFGHYYRFCLLTYLKVLTREKVVTHGTSGWLISVSVPCYASVWLIDTSYLVDAGAVPAARAHCVRKLLMRRSRRFWHAVIYLLPVWIFVWLLGRKGMCRLAIFLNTYSCVLPTCLYETNVSRYIINHFWQVWLVTSGHQGTVVTHGTSGDSSLSVSLSRVSLSNWYKLSSRRGRRSGRGRLSRQEITHALLEYTRDSWR